MKIILLFTMLVFGLAANAQAVFEIKSPASIKGFYSFGYGDSTSLTWNNGVLSKKSITGDLVLATGADSLAGSALTGNYTGKIAVIYRGTYGYSVKALNAQNAGAIAVIVINHGINSTTKAVDSLEIFNLSGMLNGETTANATGKKVTIPIILVSLKDGSAISKVLRNKETVTGYIGKKLIYDNDLALSWKYSLQPKYYTRNSKLTLEGEVSDTFAIKIFNKGNLPQDNIVCTARITNEKNDTLFSDYFVYSTKDSNNVVKPVIINKGDTTSLLFFNKGFAPKFDLKAGHYKLTYEVLNFKNDSLITSDEDFPIDNKLVSDFFVSDTLFSTVPLDNVTINDPVTKVVKVYNNAADLYNFEKLTKSSTLNFTTWTACMVLKDPNANRVQATGMSFWAQAADSLNKNAVLKGQNVSISFWEWNDEFNIKDTFMFNKAKNVALIDNQNFTFKDSLSIIYQNVKFDDVITLEDNKKYAVCFTSLNDKINFGYSEPNSVYYNSLLYNTPYTLAFVDSKVYGSILGTNYPFAMTLDLVKNNKASVNELDELDRTMKVYPNPATTSLNVSFELQTASDVNITVTDLSGKVVYNSKSVKANVGVNNMNIDTKAFNNGMYVLNVISNNSVVSKKFNVMQ